MYTLLGHVTGHVGPIFNAHSEKAITGGEVGSTHNTYTVQKKHGKNKADQLPLVQSKAVQVLFLVFEPPAGTSNWLKLPTASKPRQNALDATLQRL